MAATSADDSRVRCIAYRAGASGKGKGTRPGTGKGKGATLLWLANMTAQPQTVHVAHTGARPFGIVLDEASFVQATTEPAAFQAGVKALDISRLRLRAYAVALACINDR